MDLYEEIVALRQQGRRGALATIVRLRGSAPAFTMAKMLVREDGSIVGTVGGGRVEADVRNAAREVMAQETPRTLSFDLNQMPDDEPGLICGGTVDIFIEPLVPPAPLYIFGAGHVGRQLYSFARSAGFEVTVIDDRADYANQQRFPDAHELIAEDVDRACEKLHVVESAFIAILTRNHREDIRVLRWAVGTPARYVGMIGSERKVATLFVQLQKEGVSAEQLERVHAPIGLKIGAVTPEEIAVSILAEMIAVRRNALPQVPGKARPRLHMPEEPLVRRTSE